MNETSRASWIRVLAWVPLGIAIVLAAVIGAEGILRVKAHATHAVEVTGSAKRRITSDLAEWEARVATENADFAAGYRDLAGQVAKLRAWLEAQGAKPDEIQVGSAARSENVKTEVTGSGDTRLERQVRTGWTTAQSVFVRSSDVNKVARLSREVTALIEQGVAVDSFPPAYFYTKLGGVKIEMLAEAARDARTRAVRMVAAATDGDPEGEPPFSLRNLDMGVINVNPALSTATSWDGNNDTTSLEKDIITIVHCKFDLQ